MKYFFMRHAQLLSVLLFVLLIVANVFTVVWIIRRKMKNLPVSFLHILVSVILMIALVIVVIATILAGSNPGPGVLPTGGAAL